MQGAVLSAQSIRRYIEGKPPLVADYVDLEAQLQPHGFDLTLQRVEALGGPGALDLDNSRRRLPPGTPLPLHRWGTHLGPGAYIVTFHEVITLPTDLMALAWPRSSLLRCGAVVHNAVWDAGYSGRSQALLVVHNPYGITLYPDARLVQVVFIRLDSPTHAYRGIYQGENL